MPDSENPRGFARDILECCGGPGEPTDCTAYWSAVCCGPCRTAQLAAHVLKWRFLPSISFLAATLTLGLLLYIPFNPTFPVLPYFQFKEVLYLAGFTFLISLWILTCCIVGAVRNRIREAEGMANQNCSGGLGDEDYMAACCCTACASLSATFTTRRRPPSSSSASATCCRRCDARSLPGRSTRRGR